MRRFVWFASLLLLLPLAANAGIVEGFDNVANLGASGWSSVNNSSPTGTTGWFQGNPGVFTSQSGADDSYVAANFLNAAAGGNISNWGITPMFSLSTSNRIVFWTRTEAGSIWPDSLEVRLSTNGSSSNVGSTATSVGDFTTLLLAVNSAQSIGGYPEAWTQYVIDIGAYGPGTTGRLAFRYLVTNTNVNGDYIGIDTFSQTPTPEPMTLITLGTAVLGLAGRRFAQKRG